MTDMARVTIDDKEVQVAAGSTILDAAEKLGIGIPTMCFAKDCEPSTSCMLCVVEIDGRGSLVPACAGVAENNMSIRTDTEQIRYARRTALELLLSDHAGDCIGPCQIACPAKMNIPLMIRQIAAGKLRDAIITVKQDIALPAVLGRICPGPCENACRRGPLDEPISICLLKRYVADVDLKSDGPYLPRCAAAKNKSVAIIGAGPAGLAAAFHLLRQGYACTIFDDHEKPGGMLRYAVPEEKLGRDVLDAEIAIIEKLGAQFELETQVSEDELVDLYKDFDAVIGAGGGGRVSILDSQKPRLDTPDENRKRKLAVRAVANGKQAALALDRQLSGRAGVPEKPFNTKMGRLKEEEIENLRGVFAEAPRIEPADMFAGFTEDEARAETTRCMHCDCRKGDSCKLRQYARKYKADPAKYRGERRLFRQYPLRTKTGELIYEPGKCINCGLCIQVAAQSDEETGLAFTNRGFDVRVAVPFEHPIADAVAKSGEKCVNACPTGALAFND